MLSKGIVEPSNSPWSSPIVLVKKKDGSTRFCVDFRQVNNLTRKDAQPLPDLTTLWILTSEKLAKPNQFHNSKNQRVWLEILAEFDYAVAHQPGIWHTNVDSVSHKECKQCGRF